MHVSKRFNNTESQNEEKIVFNKEGDDYKLKIGDTEYNYVILSKTNIEEILKAQSNDKTKTTNFSRPLNPRYDFDELLNQVRSSDGTTKNLPANKNLADQLTKYNTHIIAVGGKPKRKTRKNRNRKSKKSQKKRKSRKNRKSNRNKR
jgi:septum formation inhibitor MinC